MPIGVFLDAIAVVVGGLAGALVGKKLHQDMVEALNLVFGACSMAMGIGSIVLMKNMPAVVLAIIAGTVIGLAVRLGARIEGAAASMRRGMTRFCPPENERMTGEQFDALLVTSIVLFCASGTGIYGSVISGMTGDHSILIAKSILDLFSAMIFACNLGLVVSGIAVPQVLIFSVLFFGAGLIYPLMTPAMVDDFKACGGIIMLCTGFRMVKLRPFPIADMLPSMVLVLPLSWGWSNFVLPLVS